MSAIQTHVEGTDYDTLLNEALADLELDATDSLDDDWQTYRHYAARSLDFIAQIRALDNA